VESWVQPNDHISFTFGFILLELYQYKYNHYYRLLLYVSYYNYL
jgi:hypothetical protein